MNELIERLVNEVGLTPEQARKAVDTGAWLRERELPYAGRGCGSDFHTQLE